MVAQRIYAWVLWRRASASPTSASETKGRSEVGALELVAGTEEGEGRDKDVDGSGLSSPREFEDIQTSHFSLQIFCISTSIRRSIL